MLQGIRRPILDTVSPVLSLSLLPLGLFLVQRSVLILVYIYPISLS